MARMSDVAADQRLISLYPALSESLWKAASQQLRNMASLGGNLLQRTRCPYFRGGEPYACNKRQPGSGCAAIDGHNRGHALFGGSDACIATYPGDFAVPLVAFDARVDVAGPAGSRVIPIADLHLEPGDTPQRENALRAGELILRIRVPATAAGRASTYHKIRDRESYGFAVVSVAAALQMDGDIVREARLALGGVATRPWRAASAESYLSGKPLTPENARAAGDIAFADARTTRENAFKTELGARGKIVSLDVSAALSERGVRDVFTHETIGPLVKVGFLLGGGYAFQSFQPMLSDIIAYRGQPIALVVAETLEAAVHAASLVKAEYAPDAFSATIGSDGASVIVQSKSPLPQQLFGDTIAGDATGAWEASTHRIDATFQSPPQHQNPIELIATVAEWKGDMLTIYEGTQNASALRNGVAEILAIDAKQVNVISPSAGGSFGQKNSLQMQTALVAAAARKLGVPVKLVFPRSQLFHNASFRPASLHRVRLGADKTGRVVAALYDVDAQTSRHDLFPADYTNAAARLYGIPNFQGHQRLVQTDVQTPGYMRAPYEHLASFAMECAMDEMAFALNRDPVQFRIAHDTATDPVTGLPFSSRHVAECLEQGARMFAWSRRRPEPGSMRAANGDLVGMGVAIGCYKAATAAASARLTTTSDGRLIFSTGVHEMGQGVRTALTNILSTKLNVPPERVELVLGDTRGAPQHLTAGSWGTATAIPAAAAAAELMLQTLGAGSAAKGLPEALRSADTEDLTVEVDRLAPGQPSQMMAALKQGKVAAYGPIYPDFVSFSYAAHFVEIHVDASTMRVRVPHVVSVVDCGRVVSPRTAQSQVRGGVVWGIGAALREATEVDTRYGGFLNSDIAEYMIPVHADIGRIDVAFIDKPDLRLNDIGVKGLGEVVMTGVAPAIANALFHATGRRLRNLPIRIEHLL
eukprot:g25173.t1